MLAVYVLALSTAVSLDLAENARGLEPGPAGGAELPASPSASDAAPRTAKTRNGSAASKTETGTETAIITRRALGLTLDLLPIALSASAGEFGASGQVWIGIDHLRLRAVGARLAFPNWLAEKDRFIDRDNLLFALIVDYVFGDHFDHWWIGSGLEYWHETIGHRDYPGTRVDWNTPVWTLGGGYIWRVVGNAYLEPWAAGHLALSGAQPTIGVAQYKAQRLNGEISLKLGVFFEL